ncbi:hypothetical protein ACFFIY_01160 [Bhargavaea ullalensis]|uniref:Cob(I)alamin adenosyltransferase n=1 Tax=Bhargavaea ullalensis TaxID=1265685 RepID=A0ABV2G778_9BACL
MRGSGPFQFGQINSGPENRRDSGISPGTAIGFVGAILELIGGTLEVVGAAIAIEEDRIADEQLQEKLEQIQQQIDELNDRLDQSEASGTNERIVALLEKVVENQEADDK